MPGSSGRFHFCVLVLTAALAYAPGALAGHPAASASVVRHFDAGGTSELVLRCDAGGESCSGRRLKNGHVLAELVVPWTVAEKEFFGALRGKLKSGAAPVDGARLKWRFRLAEVYLQGQETLAQDEQTDDSAELLEAHLSALIGRAK